MTPEIYVIKVNTPIDENTFQFLLSFVSDEKKERILRNRIQQNADNMLIGEILARFMIKKTFGVSVEEQSFCLDKHGKPFLAEHPDIHFNISHSGEYVACGVSNRPIGIDIQKIGLYKPDLAQKVCTENELAGIESTSNKASEFTRLWTQKEAVLKMNGTGIRGDIKNCLENFNVDSKKIDEYWLSVWCP